MCSIRNKIDPSMVRSTSNYAHRTGTYSVHGSAWFWCMTRLHSRAGGTTDCGTGEVGRKPLLFRATRI